MKRREFVSLAASAAVIPLIARAQQRSMPVVGLLGATTAQGYAAQLAAYRQGLSEAGFIKVATWSLNIVGRTINTTAFRDWLRILSAAAWL
jgi:hypothetical protein